MLLSAQTNPLTPSLGEVVVSVVALLLFVVWVVMLVDVARRPQQQWRGSGQSQDVWLVVVALTGGIGALLYAGTARRRLRATG